MPAVSFSFWLILIIVTITFRGTAILNSAIFTNDILRGYRVASVAVIGCFSMVAFTVYLFTEKRKSSNGLILVNQLTDCEDTHNYDQQTNTETKDTSFVANNKQKLKGAQYQTSHVHSHQNVLSIEHEQANAVAEINSREADEGYLINIIAWLTIPLAIADSVFVFLPIILDSTGYCNSTSPTATSTPHTVAPHHHGARTTNHSEIPHSIHATAASESHATTIPPDLCIRNIPLFYCGSIIFAMQKLIQGKTTNLKDCLLGQQ